jgi:hypothetical protein
MSYLLAATSIRSPNTMSEDNTTQVTQIRTLSGAINRDYFGSNKRIWKLEYKNLQKADYDTLNTIYQAYLLSGTPVAWQITETNYAVAATTVHVDLLSRDFSAKGSGYLSDITLILTEA